MPRFWLTHGRYLGMSRIGAAVILVTVLAGSAAAATRTSEPRVLARVPDLQGFAQDGRLVAWASYAGADGSCPGAVRLRDLGNGRTTNLYRGGSTGCRGGFQHPLALGGHRALWATVSASLASYHFSVETSSGSGVVRSLGNQHTDKRDGYAPIPMAGDGETLVYANVSTTESTYGFGYVHRADKSRIAGSFATVALAAASDTFAAARDIAGGCACDDPSGVKPLVSPDGTRVAFERSYGNRPPDATASESIARTDGNGSERTLPKGLSASAWSPDGKWLLATTDSWVVLLDPNTLQSRRVARGRAAVFSPDGSHILCTYLNGSDETLTAIAVEGGSMRSFGRGSAGWWLPDSRRVVFMRGQSLFAADLATPVERRLATDVGGWVSISPAGDEVAFIDAKTNALRVVSPAGGEPRTLAMNVTALNWSSDGQQLSYLAGRQLHIVGSDGSGAMDLGETESLATWSPDGTQFAFQLGSQTGKTFVVAKNAAPRFVAVGDDLKWSPDSEKLAVSDSVSNVTHIIAPGSDTQMDSVWPFSWLPDSRHMLVELQTGQYAGAIASVSTTSTARTRITEPDVTSPWRGVELRDFSSGKIRGRFATVGLATAVAIDRQRVVVLMRIGNRQVLEIRQRSSLEHVRTVEMPKTVTSISLSGRWIVYASDGRIWALDVTSGKRKTVARTSRDVLAPTIEGTRVVWGENSALLTITLSAR